MYSLNKLYVQTRSGTLIDFLDELDPTLITHVAHCSMLSRQKAGSLAFDRDRRPGDISADIDFTETEIAKRRGKLSQHKSMYPLYAGVAVA